MSPGVSTRTFARWQAAEVRAEPMDRYDGSSTSGSPRVLVIDGSLLTAEAIVLALTQVKLVARFVLPVTIEHLRDVIAWEPDLALFDIDSVDATMAVEIVAILGQAGVPVAVVGGRDDRCLLGECVKGGVASVVDKASPLIDLLRTVRSLLDGEVLLDDAARQLLVEPYQREERARQARLAPFQVLTHREKCVLAELMAGNGAEAIARGAYVSVSTVRSQIKAVLQKLGVNSQLAAAALARQAGWTLEASEVGTEISASA